MTTLKSPKGELALDPLLKAELLNDFFSECFTDDHGTLTETRCTLPVDVGLSSILFSNQVVYLNLLKLNGSQTITPDGFHQQQLSG